MGNGRGRGIERGGGYGACRDRVTYGGTGHGEGSSGPGPAVEPEARRSSPIDTHDVLTRIL